MSVLAQELETADRTIRYFGQHLFLTASPSLKTDGVLRAAIRAGKTTKRCTRVPSLKSEVEQSAEISA